VGGAVFLGDATPLGLEIMRGVDRPVTCQTKSYVEKHAFTMGLLIRCQSYHGDYACTLGRVTMLGGDGTDSCIEYLLPGMRGASGHVLSYQTVNVSTSR
jgi:hypothetical protein